jgi:uncharacterized protein YdaT
MKTQKLTANQSKSKVISAYVKAASQHVLPSEDGWKVKKSHAQKATKIFENKKEAVEYARKIAKKQETELFIHKKNGQITERNTYGRDPFPPRG